MARFDFCGGSYTSTAVTVDNQSSKNLHPEIVETGDGRSKLTLLSDPGIAKIAQLDAVPRAEAEFNGRLFVVGGVNFYEVVLVSLSVPGLPTVPIAVNTFILNPSTSLANDGRPASIAVNENQLLIASAGRVYIYYLNAMNDSVTGLPIAAGTFAQVPPSNFTLASGNAPVSQVAFCDSFFLALLANSQNVQISNVLDGFNWIPGGSIVGGVYTGGVSSQIVVSVYPDNVVGMAVDHRQLWLLGRKATVGYTSGDPFNIFAVQPGAYIEQGAVAQFAISKLDNSLFWVSGDDKGDGMAFRLNGLTPQRITTHAIEAAWRAYPKRSDAVSYSWQDGGHSSWRVLFPSANKGNGATWEYDVATGLWHECDFLNETSGASMGHPSWIHAYWNGAHIVGDWRSANLYQMDAGLLDNAGVPIRFVRRAPHVSTELEMMRYDRFILDIETGAGPTLVSTNVPPSQIVLRDASGQLWAITVSDVGDLQTQAIGAGTPQVLTLNDPSGAASWQVGVTLFGQLFTTPVAFSSLNPASSLMNSKNFYWNLQVSAIGDLETVKGSVITRAPLVSLRFSDDGGRTWSNYQPRSMGFLGEYKTRVIWHRLGAARIRTFEISCSEPIQIRIVDAYINAAPGFSVTERLTKQYQKVA